MSTIVFIPEYNSANKRDADEFAAEAKRFCTAIAPSATVVRFDNRLPPAARREQVVKALCVQRDVKTIAFFCHGWANGIQAGFTIPYTAALAACIHHVAAPKLNVLLYCCSTASDGDKRTKDEELPGPGGDGGFADLLRDNLGIWKVDAKVYAHTTAGHCTQNPRMRVFLPGETKGGPWVISPDDKELWLTWAKKLNAVVTEEKNGKLKKRVDETNTFRFDFPFMADAELSAYLHGVRAGKQK